MFQVGDKVLVAADAKATCWGEEIDVHFNGKEVVGMIVELPDGDGDCGVFVEGFLPQFVSPQYLTKIDEGEAVEEEPDQTLTVEIDKLYRAAEWRGSVGRHELSQIIQLANELA